MSTQLHLKKQLAAATRRLQAMQLRDCFDPIDNQSRPTIKQQEVLNDIGRVHHRYVRAGNQGGKSQTGAREAAWLFLDNHPHWTRPVQWGSESLTMIIVGKTRRLVEDELWGKKIKQFLPADSYKEVRVSSSIDKIVNTTNGNTIILLSHDNPVLAWERLQGYVAHWVWVDEMPKSIKIIEEAHRRIQARNGYFLATFTPKIVNSEIRRLVDAAEEPYAKVYRFHMFDNPIYKDAVRREEIIASLKSYSSQYQKTILEGEWAAGEEQVYYFDYDAMVGKPTDYNKLSWRHVESVDPALKSALGYTVWAEDPKTGVWYCVRAEYITGILVPEQIVAEVAKRSESYNIVRRICDPHESWYLGQANHMKIKPIYICPYNKNTRKGELIKNLQAALGNQIKIDPKCTDLIKELEECRWSESADGKIANSSKYHLLDSAQYFIDLRPKKQETEVTTSNWESKLYDAHVARKVDEEKKQEAKDKLKELRKKNRIRNKGKRSIWK